MMSSAAAEGVGARRSATKSAMVKSVSWPMAETTGSAEAAMARARASSLKPARSSMEPPPRAMRMRSALSGCAVEPADAGDDGGGAAGALHGGGIDEQVEAGVAAADDLDDVVEDGAARWR